MSQPTCRPTLPLCKTIRYPNSLYQNTPNSITLHKPTWPYLTSLLSRSRPVPVTKACVSCGLADPAPNSVYVSPHLSYLSSIVEPESYSCFSYLRRCGAMSIAIPIQWQRSFVSPCIAHGARLLSPKCHGHAGIHMCAEAYKLSQSLSPLA